MKKIIFTEILFVLLLVLMVGFLALRNQPKDVTAAEMERVFTARSDFNEMEKFGDMRLRRNLGLEPADFTDYVYYGQSDTMAVQVFFFANCPSESQAEATEQRLRAYVNGRIHDFEGYGESQTAMLKNARIYRNGSHVALIVSGNAASWESALKKEAESAPLAAIWQKIVRLFRKEG